MRLIEHTAGVEILNIFTPYRFRIAIGQAFDAGTVKKDIDNSLKALLSESEEDEEEI